MKITKQLLREIIEEEVRDLLEEQNTRKIATAEFEEVFGTDYTGLDFYSQSGLSRDGRDQQYVFFFLGSAGRGRTPEEAVESFFQDGPRGKSRIIEKIKRGLLSKIKKN